MICFRMFGVRIQINFLFVAMVTVFLLTDRTGISVIALLACFIHELGHLIAFFLVGYTPKALIFELMGIRLVKPEQELSPGKEAVVQLAGSMVNFLMFFLLAGTLKQVSYWSLFAATHLLMGIFQLMPLKSLDGGKLLELLCVRLWGERAADMICTTADFAATVCMMIMAAVMVLTGSRSLTLAIFSGGLFISLIAKFAGHRGRMTGEKVRQ